MALPSSTLTRLHISHALGTRSTRIAVLIVEMLRLVRELLQEQPSAVVEALIEHWEPLCREEKNPSLKDAQIATLKYARHLLDEAKKRERRLYHGLTGNPEPDES